MKRIFQLEHDDPKPSTIFKTEIDEEGDFIVKANGVIVGWFDCESGRFLTQDTKEEFQQTTGLLFKKGHLSTGKAV